MQGKLFPWFMCSTYRICSIRRCGYYLFHHAILCGFYSRAATNREWRLLNSVSGKMFRKCNGFEKSQFIRLTKNIRCGDLVLKQTFQLLDQPPLCYRAVPTSHLQSVSSFCSSNDFTRWSPSVPQKLPNFSGQLSRNVTYNLISLHTYGKTVMFASFFKH